MGDVSSRLVASMNSLGIVQVKDSTKKYIFRKLESEFGGVLHIFSDVNWKLLIYPDNLSELAKDNQSLKAELRTLKSLSAEDVVAKAVMQLRADIHQDP